jgi:iron complex outermembrane receptor protein
MKTSASRCRATTASRIPKAYGTAFVRVGRTQRALNRQYDALIAALNTANPGRNFSVPSRNVYDRLTDIDASLNAGNKIGGASAKVKWDVGPGTFTSITAWRFWDWKPENDRDFTGASIVSKSQNPSQQDQYSQEFRYNYSGDKLDFVVGLFGFKQRIDTQGTEQQGPNASLWSLTAAQGANDPSVLNGLTATNTQFLKSTSAALYGQLSYKITPELTIQPGIRVNYDKKSGFYERVVTNGAGQVINCTPPLPANSALAAQCGVYQPQEHVAVGQRLELQLRLQHQLQGHAGYPCLCDLCEDLQDGWHQPERSAAQQCD